MNHCQNVQSATLKDDYARGHERIPTVSDTYVMNQPISSRYPTPPWIGIDVLSDGGREATNNLEGESVYSYNTSKINAHANWATESLINNANESAKSLTALEVQHIENNIE